MANHKNTTTTGRDEEGFAIVIAIIATVIPLVLILGATSQTMLGRLSRLEHEIQDERAMLASESGVDEAIYRASTVVGLPSNTPFTHNLGGGMSVTVTPTFLGNDLVNNDGDGATDEADEQVYRVQSVGTYRNNQRRVVAYLGPQTSAFTTTPGALSITGNPAGKNIALPANTGFIGTNYLMSGAPGSPVGTVNGLTTVAPYTAASVTALLTAAEQNRVTGLGASPSVGVSATTFDFAAIQLAVQNAANVVVVAASVNNFQFGNSSTLDFKITYRNGDLQIKGTSRGAGILFVTGNLSLQGNFRFDGIIYVMGGQFEMQGNSELYGTVVTGPATNDILMQDHTKIYYSTEAIGYATAIVPSKFVILNGWQEISRH